MYPIEFRELFYVWRGIKVRCNQPSSKSYRYYGGRGIKICERWNDFRNFCADMGQRPIGTVIDRIDVNGNYEPGNCRWATIIQSANNKRSNRFFTLNGVRKTMAEWSHDLGIDRRVIHKRLVRGWPMEKAITMPLVSKFKDHRTNV